MAEQHACSAQFIEFINATQQDYAQRRADEYMQAFSADYSGVQLGTGFHEDRAGLERKIRRDIERYGLEQMDFELVRHWYSGETAFAHLKYHSRLKENATGNVLVDERENIVVARHQGGGRWLFCAKITISARNYPAAE